MLIGIIVILLAAIPLTVYFLQQNQETRSHAQAATTLYFASSATTTALTGNVQKNVGDTIPLDIIVDPGSNQVSFIKMSISYDPTKLSLDQTNGIVPNSASFPSVLEGPTFANGTVTITLSIGADPTKVAQSPTKVATITFTATNTTGSTPTTVKFLDDQTQVLSIASTDQPSENVLSATKPANIAIAASATTTITPTPSSGATPTPTTLTPTVTPTTSPATSGNAAPTCTLLTASPATSGTAPFTITFTANGKDSDGTISKATFNFGDGPVQDATQSGGIGTNLINAQTTHVYNTAGTYQASVVLTDNTGAVSANTCTKTITIAAASAPTQVTQLPLTGGGTPQPTLPAAGPGDTIIKGGAVAAIVSIVGALMFFAL
ncbi:MAG TPA: PKD domain-containing protein [Legionellaceae bacterium]|nr:PKD domain-containing protein [Legionellaceae bacterium]